MVRAESGEGERRGTLVMELVPPDPEDEFVRRRTVDKDELLVDNTGEAIARQIGQVVLLDILP